MKTLSIKSAPRLLYAILLALSGCDLFTDADTRVQRAESLLEAGAYNEAMVELKNALADEPNHARAQVALARTSLQLGRFDAAVRALDIAQAAGVSREEIDGLRAQVMLRSGQNVELAKALESETLRPPAAQYAVLRARALGGSNRCSEAVPLARKLLAEDAKRTGLSVTIAECLARRGNTAGALQALDAAVAALPRDAEVWMARGRLHQVLGNKREAEECWGKAAEFARGQLNVPQMLLLLSGLADLQIERGDLQSVKRTHAAILQIAPGNTVTELLGAQVNLMQGKSEDATATLQRLVSADPELIAGRVLLSSALLAQGNVEQARQQVALLASKAPRAADLALANQLLASIDGAAVNSEDYWLKSAAAHVALGQQALARAAFVRAQQLAPKGRGAALGLAQLDLRAGDTAAALQRAEELLKQFPDDAAALSLMVQAYEVSGRYAAAATTMEKLHSNGPTAASAATLHRIRRAGKLGNENEPLEQWLAKNPRDAAIRMLYAESLRLAGSNPKAIGEFETLLDQKPQDVAALNNLAWLYYLAGDPRALGTAKRAWELAPQHSAVADTYGWLMVESGKVRDGLEILGEADAKSGSTRPEIRYHYAAALARDGKRGRAKELIQDLLANYPEFPQSREATALLQSISASEAT